MKRTVLFITLLSFLAVAGTSQTMTQISYVIKKGFPGVKKVAVIYPAKLKGRIIKESQLAQVTSRISVVPYAVKIKTEILSALFTIRKEKNMAVVVIADDTVLSKKSIKMIVSKLGSTKIPIISTREKDTLNGVLLTIYNKNGKIEKHLNLLAAEAKKINLSASFKSECVVDVE